MMDETPNQDQANPEAAAAAGGDANTMEPAGATPAGAEATIAALTAQVGELKDRHLRLQAEFENFRKRKMREAEEIRAYAATSVLSDILPVIDHLELALDATHDRTDASWGQGIDLIARQLADALKANGLEPITAAAGDKFDPAWHEAVSEEAANGAPAGSIVRVYRKGYRIRERLLRAAQVVVARMAAPAAPSAAETAKEPGANATNGGSADTPPAAES